VGSRKNWNVAQHENSNSPGSQRQFMFEQQAIEKQEKVKERWLQVMRRKEALQ
jgi:hypothetical protein